MTRIPAPITARLRLKLLAGLRRVNKQLSQWDEMDAMELMPPPLRPALGSQPPA